MLKSVSNIILYTSPMAVIPPLILAWIKFRYAPGAYRILSFHLLFVGLSSIVSLLLWKARVNNLPVLHAYTVIEFGFIMFFYAYVLQQWFPLKWALATVTTFTLLALINGLYIGGWYTFNTLPRGVESILVLAMCITCYHSMMTQLKNQRLDKDPLFFINTGFLFYFSGSLFLFIMSNYILPLDIRLNMMAWSFHALLSDILYLFIFVGLWNIRKI